MKASFFKEVFLMKVFHTENGKEIVYVQMQDIMYLSNETDIPIPATIFTKKKAKCLSL